jgi:hypothetical protein
MTMFLLAIQIAPQSTASWLQIAWIFQALLTLMAVVGMIGRLFRRQRKFDA